MHPGLMLLYMYGIACKPFLVSSFTLAVQGISEKKVLALANCSYCMYMLCVCLVDLYEVCFLQLCRQFVSCSCAGSTSNQCHTFEDLVET
jgi:hypothetical protein